MQCLSYSRVFWRQVIVVADITTDIATGSLLVTMEFDNTKMTTPTACKQRNVPSKHHVVWTVSHSIVQKNDQENTQTLWHVTSTHAVGLSCLTVSLQSTHKSLTYLIHAKELIQVMLPKLDYTICKFSWLKATYIWWKDHKHLTI